MNLRFEGAALHRRRLHELRTLLCVDNPQPSDASRSHLRRPRSALACSRSARTRSACLRLPCACRCSPHAISWTRKKWKTRADSTTNDRVDRVTLTLRVAWIRRLLPRQLAVESWLYHLDTPCR